MLSEYRVVELGVWVAGPSAGGLLADWGAEVIKVEAPVGDPFRRMFQLAIGNARAESPPFDLDNRGKKSVVADLQSAEGLEVVRRLIATADVFITNLRPEAVQRFGLGPEEVLGRHPRLVYASITGYGREGPDAHRAGYDLGAFWARSGMAAAHTPPDDPLSTLRSGVGDHVTGLSTAAGVLAALLARERSGVGQLVETSLLRAGMYCLGWDLAIQLRYGKLAPTPPRTETQNPVMNSYRAGDGKWFWLLGLEADRHWPRLMAALERNDLAEDPRFADPRGRRKNARELIGLLDEEFSRLPRDEWVHRFDREDVWWAPVNTPADVVADPQADAAGAFVDVPEGAGAPGHRAVATPVAFGSHESRIGAVPALGEHTAEILEELGMATDTETERAEP